MTLAVSVLDAVSAQAETRGQGGEGAAARAPAPQDRFPTVNRLHQTKTRRNPTHGTNKGETKDKVFEKLAIQCGGG